MSGAMWERGWRDRLRSQLDQPWDLIVIGGGVTGAGILREATRAGLNALLVEAADFASGTSSRSGKLVHGGLRYLRQGQVRLTVQSVREREQLLRQGRGLVNPLPEIMACFRGDPVPAWLVGVGLDLYDLLAGKWGHRRYPPSGLRELCPPLTSSDLVGGYRYFDAQTDDARLVLRVMREAVREGAAALNYTHAETLLRSCSAAVCGVVVRDQAPGAGGRSKELQARAVISATGAWADSLRTQVGGRPRLRLLRGSHLFLSAARLPLERGVSMLHPSDGRGVCVYPWEGVIIAGTTDVDHGREAETDPRMEAHEAEYLLQFLTRTFPSLELTFDDVISTHAGIRAVVNTGKADPSKESREHVLWDENGLLTVTGGKLTTFRRIAHDALRKVRARWPHRLSLERDVRVLSESPAAALREAPLDPSTRLRLVGRYGADVPALVRASRPGELEPVDGCAALWAELRWAAREEGVVHLEDLLLRRVRLGLIAPQGGIPLLERMRPIVQPELGWEDGRWNEECEAYGRLWRERYRLR